MPSPDSTIVDDPDQPKEKETIYNVNRFELLNNTMVKDNAEEFMAASIISVVEMTKTTDSKYKGTYVMNPDHFTHAISQLESMREEVTDKRTAAKERKKKRKVVNDAEKKEDEEANNRYMTTSGDRAARHKRRKTD